MRHIPRCNGPKLDSLLIKESQFFESGMYVGLCLFEILEGLDFLTSLLELYQAFWCAQRVLHFPNKCTHRSHSTRGTELLCWVVLPLGKPAMTEIITVRSQEIKAEHPGESRGEAWTTRKLGLCFCLACTVTWKGSGNVWHTCTDSKLPLHGNI